ncbi:MAG TPA: metalloregulator ArsR/SmtB family transcription factor [Ktedonobacteraceae bacterium]|nr:metalloregulator ArsR/SmtB family transcription factor [Ktedonobacteraceae bacterium]
MSQQKVVVRVALEPVYNMLNTFSLLHGVGNLTGLNSKVVQTATALSAAQLHTNRLIFEGLRDALVSGQDEETDFLAYLKNLRAQAPEAIRDRVLERLRARFARCTSSQDAANVPVAPDTARLLSDVQAYLTCVEYVLIDLPFDRALHTEAHSLLNNAHALHALLVSHLETLWQTAFEAEWKRVQPSLRWQVGMFTRALDEAEAATIAEIFSTLTGRDLPLNIAERPVDAEEIILVPSWHTGRNVLLWESDASVRLFFSEPPNYDVALLRSTAVGRSELRSRLSALADETRLHILEMLAQQDELPAQDIIAQLGLSQSNVSRHLKQLVSAGFLYERRGEGANKTYRLSSFYLDRTARALRQIAADEQARTGSGLEAQRIQETKLPQELRRFLDRAGKLTTWPPARQRDKLLILEYLASFFEMGRVYNEKEVNEILLLHSAFKDAAALRRALYEYRFMSRTRDGSRYWLVGSEAPE